jgi:predicted RNase H-like nuclease (RuvC/YqgF family)
VRKEEIERAMVEEVGHLFESWASTKRVMEMMNDELRAVSQQQSAERVEIERELTKVDAEIANLRRAIKGGFDDLEWANEEMRRLKAQREELLGRQAGLKAEPQVPEFDLTQVEECRRRFSQVFAEGTNEGKSAFARQFVKKIEVDPDTADIWMHLFSRPPGVARKATPASKEAGVAIGLVAGACWRRHLHCH